MSQPMYTVVVPIKAKPGHFRRLILDEDAFHTFIDKFISGNASDRFYCEAHNGSDEPSTLRNWPEGFYK